MSGFWALALSLAIAAGAEEAREAPGSGELQGRVAAIDHPRKRVRLEGKRQAVLLQVDTDTTIFVDGQIAALDELQPGMDVRASFRGEKGARPAQWIEANRPRPPQLLPEKPK